MVRRERANLDRLAAALRELHARLRVGGVTDAEAKMLPVQIDSTTLEMAGMSTWMTDAGPFDVLAGLTSGLRATNVEAVLERALAHLGVITSISVANGGTANPIAPPGSAANRRVVASLS